MSGGFISDITLYDIALNSRSARESQDYLEGNSLPMKEGFKGTHTIDCRIEKHGDEHVVVLQLDQYFKKIDMIAIPVSEMFMSKINLSRAKSPEMKLDLQPEKPLEQIFDENWQNGDFELKLAMLDALLKEEIDDHKIERPKSWSKQTLTDMAVIRQTSKAYKQKFATMTDEAAEEALTDQYEKEQTRDFEKFIQKLEEKWLEPGFISQDPTAGFNMKILFFSLCDEAYIQLEELGGRLIQNHHTPSGMGG